MVQKTMLEGNRPAAAGKSAWLGLACLLSVPAAIDCAHGHIPPSPAIRAEKGKARDVSFPQGDFEKKFKMAEKELAQADLLLAKLRAVRAAMLLKATVSKLRRLEGFGISPGDIAAGLGAAASDLESGRLDAAERAVEKIGDGIEILRKNHIEKTKAETDSLLDKLKASSNRPAFLRRLSARKEKMLAKEAGLRLTAIRGLEAESGIRFEGPDLEAVRFLETNISELQNSSALMNRQLKDLHRQETARAEGAAAAQLKILGGDDASPEASSRKGQALLELKSIHRRLEKLRELISGAVE